MSHNLTAENFEAARAAAAELREMADQIISPRNAPSKLRLQRLARGVEFVVRMAEMADDLAERLDQAAERIKAEKEMANERADDAARYRAEADGLRAAADRSRGLLAACKAAEEAYGAGNWCGHDIGDLLQAAIAEAEVAP